MRGAPWSGRTSHSASEVNLRYQQHEFDAGRSWSARERVIIRGTEDYLVGLELETSLLGPTDVAGDMTALVEKAWSERQEVRSKQARARRWLLQGVMSSVIEFKKLLGSKDENHEELPGTIEYLKT